MKWYTLILIFVLLIISSPKGICSILIGKDGELFDTPTVSSIYSNSSLSQRVSGGKFVVLKKSASEGYIIHKLSGIVPLKTFLPRLSPPKKPARRPPPEGCKVHPMTWIQKSKIVATFGKTDRDALYFEIPSAAVEIKTPDDLKSFVSKNFQADDSPDYLNACLDNSKSFQAKDSILVYFACAGELNESLYIFEKLKTGSWKKVADFTTTDECP